MKKLIKLGALAVVGVLAMVPEAFASGNAGQIFDKSRSKAKETFQGIRTLVFILGGFGLVGLGGAAIFGKLQWKWFGALAVGLALVAAAGMIVEYVVEDSKEAAVQSDMSTWQ